jgi:1L-myo-inositol 1-phosphate cytidylyltransferase
MTSARRSTPSQNRVTEAVILMAGCGSRLRGSDETFLKPLLPVGGRPLVSYTINTLIETGIKTINAVIGFEAERLRAAVKELAPAEVEVRFIENREWEKQNGISLLVAAKQIDAPFVLTMSDHLFDREILERLIQSADLSQLNVAIDRKIGSVFDLNDAMKVQTRSDRIIAIGKTLEEYDAIDIGLFVCPPEISDYLERAKAGGDCSLADGVRAMALDGKVRAIDIREAWWQDVDTPEMVSEAERKLRDRPTN